jgi:acyl carrier protein phosphodiesterase
MYEEARKLPWLYCLDNVLNSMSSRRSTLRAVNKNKTGVVPECYEKLDNRWTTCACYKVLKLRKVVINTRLHIL